MKEIARKTLQKIEREEEKLEALKVKRDEFTANYQTKLAELNNDISAQKKVISELREQEKQEKLDAIAELAGQNNISVNDLLSAVLNGNFAELQDKLGGKGNGFSVAENGATAQRKDRIIAEETADNYDESEETESIENDEGYDEGQEKNFENISNF